MKEAPEISIIIPAYNEEKFLHACLSSIFDQKTKRKFEVIVVDNDSKDATREIASKFDVRLITETKPGASVTRNKGAKQAKADIIYFVDADCRLLQGGLDNICRAFQDTPSLQLVAGPYVYDQDGWFPYFATETLQYFSVYLKMIKVVFGLNHFSGGNFAIKKDIFFKVNGFDETICDQEIILPDDLDLAIRLYKSGYKEVMISRKFKIYSSFRRVKRSPIKHTLVRFFSALTIATNNLKFL